MRSNKNTYNNVLFQNEFGLSEDQVAGKVFCIPIYYLVYKHLWSLMYYFEVPTITQLGTIFSILLYIIPIIPLYTYNIM